MTDPAPSDKPSTASAEYADRLQRLSGARWKQLLNVQAPYRWNIRRLDLGRTLDVGCGLGRNLAHLGGNGVGVDHNAESVAYARSIGLEAYTVDDFFASRYARPDAFDSLLVAHVVEHMNEDEAVTILESYLPFVRSGGKVCFITPQEAGYATDETHIRFVDFTGLSTLSDRLGLSVHRQFSFPLPRAAGKMFRYNEFVQVSRLH